MKKNYQISKIKEVTVIRIFDLPSRDDLISAINEVKLLDTSDCRMWVLEKGVNLSSDDLHAVASIAAATFKRPSRMAVVAPTDLSFGLSRMFEVFREQDGVETRSFRTEENAIMWLRSPSGL